jgi:hypothetical protein
MVATPETRNWPKAVSLFSAGALKRTRERGRLQNRRDFALRSLLTGRARMAKARSVGKSA